MTQQLTKEELHDVAQLAQLTLAEDEVSAYQKDLVSILDYFKKLAVCDTDDVEEIGHITGMTNVFREDAVVACDEEMVEAMIDAFPAKKDRLISVKNVL